MSCSTRQPGSWAGDRMRRLGEIYRSHDKAAFASLGTALAGFKLRGKLGQKLVGELQATYGKLNGRFRMCGWGWLVLGSFQW